MRVMSRRTTEQFFHVDGIRSFGIAAQMVLLVGIAGCLNPDFVTQASGGSPNPIAPGDQRFVLVRVVNATQELTIDAVIGFNTPINPTGEITLDGLDAINDELGVVLECPVTQISLGSITGLGASLLIRTTEGTILFVPATAFPFRLTEGIDYNCGDTLIFSIVDNPASQFRVSVQPGRVDGATQASSFSGPDTYGNLELLLRLNDPFLNN